MVNVGFGNLVNSDKIIAVVNPDGAPIVLSPLIPDTIGRRLSGSTGPEQAPVS